MNSKQKQAELDRASQHRFILKRGDDFRWAVADGWSTHWLARRFDLTPTAVRKMRRDIEKRGSAR